VSNHFTRITAAFQDAAITFDCSTCNINAYAYVYSNQPYTIYLCSVFWSAGATGTDSKAGTLVHEMSHFNVTAGTNDNAYGQAACKKLAAKSPRKAVDNADSHEYFAENTPSLN
jgi:peptidyl-Lys metalloendopeptidase